MIINSVIAGKGGGDEVEAYALGDAKNAVKDDKVVLKENNIDENPIPYRYLAEVPVNNVFTANETLTGFVKENNGGSLTVSTVEDPNNPPPAVPDEAGLETTINYGSAGGDFGSVQVGYGYFKNTYFYPLGGEASKDKYVPYDGGLLTEDDIWPKGSKATTMNIILGRNADMGSWTSDTKGYLSTRESIVASVNKKLSTPVYLWHDLSYITPAVPETIEPEVTTRGSDYVVVGSPVISSGIASGFSADNYITASSAVGSTNNATYKVRFRVDTLGLKGPIMHYEGLFGLNIDESGNLYDWNWSNSASVNICTTTAGRTYTASVNINGTTRSWTVTDENTSETFTASLTDSTTTASSDIVLAYGRSSSPTATTYFNGSIYLEGCSVSIGGTVVWAAISTGTVSLPVSWKTLDGVIYEYPNGFPETQASELEKGQVLPVENTLNLSVKGSLQGLSENYIVSGFSASNYLYKAEKWWDTTLTSFEIVLKASVTQEGSNEFYGAYGGSYGPIKLETTALGSLVAYVYTANSNPVQIQMPSSKTPPLDRPFYLKLSYESSTGYMFWYSEDGVAYEQIAASSNVTPPKAESLSQGFTLGYDYQGGTVSYLRGSLYLKDFYIDVNGVRKYNGVLETIGGEAGLYATRTGDSCGVAISSTSPAGVDSSAVIGTVELDANGGITGYTPGE